MTLDIALLLVILLTAFLLFAVDRFSADIVAMGVMLTLIMTGLVPKEEAFGGFGSDTVLMIFGLLVMSASLFKTGVVDNVGAFILRIVGTRSYLLLPMIMVAVAVIGAFISNTAATAFFLPVVFGLATKTGESPSKFLLPLAFSSILTSSVTLISTSSNMVVSELLSRYGHSPMGMFELAPVGVPIAVVGLLYLWKVGVRLMPSTEGAEDDRADFGLAPYLTDVVVLPNSPLVGRTLSEAGIGQQLDLTVLRITRGSRYVPARGSTILEAGDSLLVEGMREHILRIKDVSGVEIKADAKLTDPSIDPETLAIVEAVVLPGSPLLGRTLKGIAFRQRFDLQVLAVKRAGATLYRKLSEIPLKMGDMLLIQGSRSAIRTLEGGRFLSILGAVDQPRLNLGKARLSLGIFVGAIVLGAASLLPLAVAMVLGAFICLLSGCISADEAYRRLEWKAIVLVACMLSLGAAMRHTGAETYLASLLIELSGSSEPFFLLSMFFWLSVFLTQIMSNQAAAVVVVPVALQSATLLGLNPRPFVMMVALAASCSYLTPLEPSCLMVYGPGRYRFFDFFKVGLPLTFLIYVICVLLVPRVWPLS
jgi:di/tricarboxylate transporter